MFSKNKIPQQQKGEKVILILRRHWFIFLQYILIFLLAASAPLLAYYFFSKTFIVEGDSDLPKALVTLFASAYYLSILLFFFSSFVNYYLDTWIVTNQRILNIEQKALFSRVVSELKLNKIQDITSEIKGIIPTFLDYGTVYIQTAGTQERFVFKQVPHPMRIRKKIILLLKQSQHFEELMKEKDKISRL